MVPADLFQSSLFSALDGAKLAYFDVRLHEAALVVAKEVCISSIFKFYTRSIFYF